MHFCWISGSSGRGVGRCAVLGVDDAGGGCGAEDGGRNECLLDALRGGMPM